jgi:hypothetical protein
MRQRVGSLMLEELESSAGRSRRTTIVFYDKAGTVVTDAYVSGTHGRFPLEELSELRRCLPYRHRGRVIAMFLGGLELALAVPFALAFRSLGVLVVGVFLALCAGIGAVRDGRRHPAWFAIKGRFRGQEVTVFSTRDEAEFQRVRLSLVRARDSWRAASR